MIASLQPKRAFLLLRNGVAFAAMVAAFGGALALVDHALALFEIKGIDRLIIPFAADALCGALGYFAFAGDGRLRVWLVFFSAIAFGAVMVVFYDPAKTFYPLLTSLPFAAVAAAAASLTGTRMERRRNIRERA